MAQILEAEHQTQARALQLAWLREDREGGKEADGEWHLLGGVLLSDTQHVPTRQQCLLCMCFRPEF